MAGPPLVGARVEAVAVWMEGAVVARVQTRVVERAGLGRSVVAGAGAVGARIRMDRPAPQQWAARERVTARDAQ